MTAFHQYEKPRKSRQKISFKNWENVVTNAERDMSFDGRDFVVQTGVDGTFVALNRGFTPKELFDIYDVRGQTFKVRGDSDSADGVTNTNKAVYIGSSPATYSAGAVDFDTDLNVQSLHAAATAVWVYLEIDTDAETWELKTTATESDLNGTDTMFKAPLWYLPCQVSGTSGESSINLQGVLDLRDTRMLGSDADNDGDQYAFKIQKASTGTDGNIDVLVGSVIRNNNELSVAALTDQTPGAGTMAVWLLLDNSSDAEYDATNPDSAVLSIGTTVAHDPADPEVFLVGTVTTAGGVITNIFQTWLGYVDDSYLPPDNDNGNSTTRSLVRDANNFLRINGFEDPASNGVDGGTIDSDDYFVINEIIAGIRTPKYATTQEAADAIGPLIPPGDIKHSDLDFNPDTGPDPTKTSNDDHDGRYWFYTGAGVDTKSFHTTGECHADDFVVQDRTANTWNAEGFAADVTAAASITTGTTFGVTATGKITITGNSNTGTDDMLFETTGAISQMKFQAAAQMNLPSDGSIFAIADLNSAGALLLQTTGASSSFDVDAANDYNEDVGGDLIVDGNTTEDDTSSGVGHGRIIDLDNLATSTSHEDAWLDFELMYG